MGAPDEHDIRVFLEESCWTTGEYSDITLHFRAESFTIAERKLHRLVLAQSRYFRALFSGGFKESQETKILIQIDDDNITEDAVLEVLHSLYKANRAVPSDISKLLALLSAASMFQVDFLIDKYITEVLKNLNASVLYDVSMAGYRYSFEKLIRGCIAWLRVNPDAIAEPGNAGRLPIELVSEVLEDDALWTFSEWHRYEIVKHFLSADAAVKAVEGAPNPEADDCSVPKSNEAPSTASSAEDEPSLLKERERISPATVPQHYSSLLRLVHLSHLPSWALEQIKADGLVDNEQVQDAYRYSKRLMDGALKDADKEDIHSYRLGFEIENVLRPEHRDEARTPWFFFAGDEWQICIVTDIMERFWLVGIERRSTRSSADTAHTGAFPYPNEQEHQMSFKDMP